MQRDTDQRLTSLLTISVFCLFVFGVVAVSMTTGWQDTLASVRALSIHQVTLLLLLSLLNYGFRALRWHVYCRGLDLPTSLAQNARHYLGGFGLTVTPGRLGELIRLRWIWLETGVQVDRTGALALVDRAADLAAVGILLAVSAVLAYGHMGNVWIVAVGAIGVAMVATQPDLCRWGAKCAWKLLRVWPKFFAQIRRAARGLTIFMRPAVSAPATGLSLMGWAAEAYAFFLLLNWLGADIGMSAAFAIFFFAMLTGGASGLPGGLGGAEVAMIAALTLKGVPIEIALPATAIIRITTLWFAIGLGVLVFPFAERYASRRDMKAGHALEPTKL